MIDAGSTYVALESSFAAGPGIRPITHRGARRTKFVFDVCDEVTVLAAGALVASGRAADVRNDARAGEVYLGQSPHVRSTSTPCRPATAPHLRRDRALLASVFELFPASRA